MEETGGRRMEVGDDYNDNAISSANTNTTNGGQPLPQRQQQRDRVLRFSANRIDCGGSGHVSGG